jgi:hypothetical protein
VSDPLPSQERNAVVPEAFVHHSVPTFSRGRLAADGALDGEACGRAHEHGCLRQCRLPSSIASSDVPKRIRKRSLVVEPLQGDTWIRDIAGSLSMQALRQYISLWCRLRDVRLHAPSAEKFIWKWTPHQQYTAYKPFFHGQCGVPGARVLSKAKAPPRCKFSLWLSLLDRCWTSERLQRHSLQNSGPCALCWQAVEFIQHLLLGYVYSREVWFRVLRQAGLHLFTPSSDIQWPDWLCSRRKQVLKLRRKGFDSRVVLVCW